MNDRELLQMALEALGKCRDWPGAYEECSRAMHTLCERLSHCDRCGKLLGDADHIHTCTPQHTKKYVTQEPVAWQWLNTAHFRKKLPKDAEPGAWNPLYAKPQRPKWRNLTEKEIDDLYCEHHDDYGYALSATKYERALEVKLKEKNT